MKRPIVWAAILSAGAGMAAMAPTISAAQTYSETFTQFTVYSAGSSQFDNWATFRASLPMSGVNSITVSGSNDTVGRSCTDPVKAQTIADTMRTFPGTNDGLAVSVSCDGSFGT